LFKEGNFAAAVRKYQEGYELVDGVEEARSIWVSCHLNAAQANINIKNYPGACTNATAVLSKEPDNLKALYRRAVARNHIGDPEEALEDLAVALELEPDNKPVKVEIQKAKKMIQDAKLKAKAAYGNVFSKMSVYDDKPLPVIPGTSPNNPKVIMHVK
jgi:tetratricopeptide (TPR) repeat protein